MTPTPERPDFAAAMTEKEALLLFELSYQDTPEFAKALSVLSALVEECEQLHAESNGKNWQGIARIAALETENKRLKDAVAHFTATIAAELKRSAAYAESCRKAEAELGAARKREHDRIYRPKNEVDEGDFYDQEKP